MNSAHIFSDKHYNILGFNIWEVTSILTLEIPDEKVN